MTPVPTTAPTSTPTPTPTTDNSAVTALISQINALAGETLTLNHASRVEALRTAYNNLSDEQKAMVTNYQTLVKLEAKIAELKKKQNSSNSNTTDISDGTKATDVTGKTGTPVYYVSNLHAGKDFYLDSLKENYQLSFSDDFSSVMDRN